LKQKKPQWEVREKKKQESEMLIDGEQPRIYYAGERSSGEGFKQGAALLRFK